MLLNIKIRAEKDASIIESVLSLLKDYDIQEIKWEDQATNNNIVGMTAGNPENSAAAAVQQAARQQIQQSGRWST